MELGHNTGENGKLNYCIHWTLAVMDFDCSLVSIDNDKNLNLKKIITA
ncbi:hypothetical protein LEP1GSC196_3865 [Leptospira meyeri serovar Semaranga str. Veldrot Semarang 173]|nr:hypothetical protein LEP1GSC196_3865 [Leptospira meyeri serovar Semaranga str. Veldrot Semarang 173]